MIPPIRKIDIETHSFCNRQCVWCSNHQYPRDFKIEMGDRVFSKIIDELAAWGYQRPIFLHRFNEPLANPENIKKRIAEIRLKLPAVKIGINTNGDYPTEGFDCDFLTITDYDLKRKEYCDEKAGVRVMHVRNLCDRGGVVKGLSKKRDSPCLEPTYVCTIDYQGFISFCCNMRWEIPTHRPFIFGNIRDTSIKMAYYSKEATQFREDVARMRFPDPCKCCKMKPGRFSKLCYSLCDNMDEEGGYE